MGIYLDEQEVEEILSDEPRFEPEPGDADEPRRARAETKDPRYELTVQILKQVHASIGHVLDLLKGDDPSAAAHGLTELLSAKRNVARQAEDLSGQRVLEGVFDGIGMVGGDGRQYPVPPNYASKSRLVEGDIMKLTIKSDGTFIYKQIGPIERRRIVGELGLDASTASHVGMAEGDTYKLLPASVSYFRGETGDEVVMLVPKSGKSVWAAVENIIKK